MKNKHIVSLILAVFLKSALASGMGLILPMPTQDDLDSKNKKRPPQQKTQQQQRQEQRNLRNKTNQDPRIQRPRSQSQPGEPTSQKKEIKNPNKVFIPLPKITKDPKTGKVQKEQPQAPRPTQQPRPQQPGSWGSPAPPQAQEVPPPPPPMDMYQDDFDYPMPDDEISVVSSGVTIPDLTVDESEVVDEMVIYPKDTGSAIFMVMKSWKCDDYDAATLLEHAVGVYAQEADDPFEIKGLPVDAYAFEVTIEEEDITLDELLDLVAQQAGREWGVDINNHSIYFYPPGVRSTVYDLW